MIDFDDYEAIGPRFESQYSGNCVLDRDHKVRRGDKVTRIQRIANPLVPVSGVACKNCTKILPRGRS